MTLTEILIAMLVMALGLLGLFALFPLGLLNVTSAVTHNRSESLGHSALADLRAHNLLAPERYLFGPKVAASPAVNNPFIRDWDTATTGKSAATWWKLPGSPGLPVVIDPIWMRENFPPPPGLGRLGIRPVAGLADAIADDGLQRVIPTDGINTDGADTLIDETPTAWPDANEQYLSLAQTNRIFGGRDDMAFREDDTSLPLLDPTGSLVSERNFTWLAIARLVDVSDPRTYEVAIATFFKRDLAGEQVLAAVYLPDLANDPTGQTPSNRVILRWPATAAEPDLHREGWILDATYNSSTYFGPHRGYWYHYVQVSDPRVVPALGEVHVTLTLDAPVRNGQTTWDSPTAASTFPGITFNETGLQALDGVDNNGNGLVDLEDFDGNPNNTAVNVAVIIPGVVSVYEKTVRAE